MNYLKSIAGTVLSSTGVSYPFTIGEKIPGQEPGSSIWELREGVKRDDGTLLTLFIFDATLPPFQPGSKDRRTLMQLAKNALKKLRTMRHPDVIKYVDSIETDTHVYIATERVRPLQGVLRDTDLKGKAKEEWIGWGVKSISTAVAFLNSLSLHHSYISPSSIYITPSMEWRLGGLDLLTTKDDAAGVLWGLGGVAPGDIGDRSGPEVRKGGWQVLRDADPALSDTYLLAMLLFSLYNPQSPLPNLSSQPTPGMAGSVPKALFPLWKRMVNPNPRTRLPTTSFVAEATATGFWSQNPLANLVDGLDGFELRSEGEKLSLLRTVKDQSGSMPQPFLLYKVLPSLLHSLSLPTAPSSAMLPLVLELGKLVPDKEYGKLVLDPVVKLYTSPDRGTRMALLDGLPDYSERMDQRTVQERVWPHLITGFADTVPVIREATVKAIFPLAPKLNDRTLNNDLLRLLAKMQTDTEPSIRTNTCILLGRLAPILGPNTKKKVLVPAFARSLKDPFVHARVAGLMAMMATVEIFDRDDLAGKVIPNMAFAMVDREKLVRDQAFKAMNMFMTRLTNMVKDMPETVQTESQVTMGPITTTSAQNGTGQAGLVNSATGAAGVLAGWAISSLSKQMSSNEVHSSMSTTAAPRLPSTAPSPMSSPAPSPSPSTSSTLPPSAPVPGFGASKSSMKLKPTRAAPAPAESYVDEWDDGGAANAWGSDDLIDVNADTDDWAAFESAPVPEIVVPPPQSYYVKPPTSSSNGTSSTSKVTKPASITPAPPVKPAHVPSPLASAKVSKPAPTPAPPPVSDGWDEPEDAPRSTATPPPAAPSLANMSKEEKELEMARRREERKARIAAMKEQKKGKP